MSKDIISQWNESAPYWEKYREIIREMFAPVTQELIAEAEIRNGHAVLDIAMGPGEPALTIADVVGPEGRVVGTDAVAEMVEAARRESHRRNLSNAKFEVAFAEKLPYADNTFDAVVCRFGVMFFPSPLDTVREMLRVMKPGARLALAVWHYGERNPFHHSVAEVVERYVATPADAGPPDMFRFAAPGELLGIVASAGATATSERLLRFSIQAKKISAEDFWTLRSEMSEKLRTKLASLSAAPLGELKREVIAALRAYSFEDGIRFSAEVLIVSGMKRQSSS